MPETREELLSRTIWTEDDQLHVDLPLYARLRGLSLDEADVEVKKLIKDLAPDIVIEDAP